MKLNDSVIGSNLYLNPNKTVLWAILAKDASKVLDFYLECLVAQNYPKELIWLYIRTNDNKDETESILAKFISDYGHLFLGVTFKVESVNPKIMKYDLHEWNVDRLKVMAEIRQESLNFAKENNFDFYFCSDVDNFIGSDTLESLLSLDLQVVAPLLKMTIPKNRQPTSYEVSTYTTYQDAIDERGSFKNSPRFPKFVKQIMKGIFQVNLVHCTYLVRSDVFTLIDYAYVEDNWEYRNFSLSLAAQGVRQYVDARRFYGVLTLSEAVEESREALNGLSMNLGYCEMRIDTKVATALAQNNHYEKYVISLERFQDRQRNFMLNNSHIDKYSLSLGTPPENFNGTERTELKDRVIFRGFTPSTFSCHLGHRRLWEKCAAGDTPFIVLEDDVVTLRDFDYILYNALKDTNEEVDFLYLGFNWDGFIFTDPFDGYFSPVKLEFNQMSLRGHLGRTKDLSYKSSVHSVIAAWGLCAYYITPAGAKKLLDSLGAKNTNRLLIPELGFDLEIRSTDAMINSFQGELDRKVLFPPIAFVENLPSQSERLNLR